MSRIFLAGAAGVVGGRLTPLLLAQGHRVWGSTRSPDKSEVLRKLGALPVAVDVFDAEALATAVLEAKPEIVIHLLISPRFRTRRNGPMGWPATRASASKEHTTLSQLRARLARVD